jgi:hypothetical protein
MHKPVSEHGDRHSLGSPGTQTVQKQHAWSLELDAQPSAARIRLLRGRGAEGLCLGAASLQYIPDASAASGPEPEPARALIPGDGAAGDQEAQNRTACPGNSGYATPAACPVSNDFLTLCSQAHLPPSNRQVRSTPIHMAKPGPSWRSSRSRTAINGHIAFGSNNFRPNRRGLIAVPVAWAVACRLSLLGGGSSSVQPGVAARTASGVLLVRSSGGQVLCGCLCG